MKKILITLLVLLLVSPTMGFSCHCCTYDSNSSVHPSYAQDHSCCNAKSQAVQSCGISSQTKTAFIHPQVLSSSIFTNHSETFGFQFSPDSKVASSPLVFSKTPLYLTYQVLRI